MNNEFVISPKWQKKINMAIRAGLQRDLYPQLVETLIELRYNVKQEIAINRQRDTKIAEWNDYNSYCEACKVEAKRLLGLEED
jgi:hypothetical protein